MVSINIFSAEDVRVVVVATTDDGEGGFEVISLEVVEELEEELVIRQYS